MSIPQVFHRYSTGIPQLFQCASEELKRDREVVMEAVRQNSRALRFASEELKRDDTRYHWDCNFQGDCMVIVLHFDICPGGIPCADKNKLFSPHYPNYQCKSFCRWKKH